MEKHRRQPLLLFPYDFVLSCQLSVSISVIFSLELARSASWHVVPCPAWSTSPSESSPAHPHVSYSQSPVSSPTLQNPNASSRPYITENLIYTSFLSSDIHLSRLCTLLHISYSLHNHFTTPAHVHTRETGISLPPRRTSGFKAFTIHS